MDANYSALQTPQFRVLSDRQIERVYQATLECLNRTGVDVHNAEARDLLAARRPPWTACACASRRTSSRMRSPPPRATFTIWGRDGQHRMQIVLDNVHYGPGPTCTYFMDPETGERRMTRRGDPGLTAKVCDALDNIDYVMSLGLIDDVTAHLAPVYEFAEMIANTGKPVLAWGYAPDNVQDIYRIALAVAGSEAALRERPFFGVLRRPTSRRWCTPRKTSPTCCGRSSTTSR